MQHRWSPNVLWQCPIPAMRRQVEAALLRSMPSAALYEATDWAAAETLIEEHDMDIVILTLRAANDTREDRLGSEEIADLAALRQLQPHCRFIVLSMQRLPASQRDTLDRLDISAVSLRHLAPTLLRPVATAQRVGDVLPDFDASAARAARSAGKGPAQPDG